VIEPILKATGGFNPEVELPKGSFPRPWPFVGGELQPAPPSPPSRPLALDKIGDKWTIVRRGEIPTVRVPYGAVPCHADVKLRDDAMIGHPARDPP
jgi:hypothetical protein